MKSTRRQPLRTRWQAAQVAVVMLLVATASSAAASGSTAHRATPEPTSDPTVEQAVADELAEQGTTDFWVVFEDQADLSQAYEIDDWAERGQHVYDQLTTTAQASQAELTADLSAQGVDHESFWIANTVLVHGGDQMVLDAVRTQDGVAEIRADEPVELPDPIEDADDSDGARVNAVEWGVANIGADRVWDDFGVRGEGVVVGSIDTGVDYTHPALVEQYRGNLGDGGFDHNYNWWDPSEICGSPSLEPCDNHGHGTHTTGTMVGDDGTGNQVGVAPGAQWIAAKGCETGSCSQAALLSAGQFMLAPTDLAGEGPRPELRPHIVNNSWGDENGPSVDPFYRDIVTAWTAAGIFGVFSNGNDGPGCDTAGSPADYAESWGVGAYDSNNTIASFSSRGPGEDDEIRPGISAPGVNVRSSLPGGTYGNFSGTSMAAPHQSGAVALLWASAPAMVGDIDLTRQILAGTAADTEDLQCGGEPGNNNVYGQGRLDAYAAVEAAPRGPSGSLAGVVTDATTGSPIEGVTISFDVDGLRRWTRTADDGTYTLLAVPVGSHDVTADAFGYASKTGPADIVADQATTLDLQLSQVPSHPVSGTIVDDRGDPPFAGATVTIQGTPLDPAATDENGHYRFEAVPEGTYTLRTAADGCLTVASVELVVDGPKTADVQLDQQTDGHGHTCRVEPADYIEATDPLPEPPTEVDLPFAFPFYGSSHSSATVDPSRLMFGTSEGAVIQPFADGLVFFGDGSFGSEQSQALTATLGEEGNRQFVIEYRNMNLVIFHDDSFEFLQVDFEVILHEFGEIEFQYRNLDPGSERERGGEATVGIQNADGSDALRYSVNQPLLSDDRAIRFIPPPGGILSGTVTDANDSEPVSGATVRALHEGAEVRRGVTDENGGYRLVQVPLGDSVLEVEASNYQTTSVTVRVDEENETITNDHTLRTARAEVSPNSLEFAAAAGQTTTQVLHLTNTGTRDMTWDLYPAGTERISLATDGTEGNGALWENARAPAISADGRYVAFSSNAPNLVPGDTNDAADIFVSDRETGTTERVSVASDGTQGNGSDVPFVYAAISADGVYVAFRSDASNLVADDTNDEADIFVRDRETGTTERVSVASDGTEGNDRVSHEPPAISADGRYAAFASSASNLVPGDTNEANDVFVHDRETGTTERVSVASDGTEGNGGVVGFPAISADGRYVAFGSLASNLVPGDTNSSDDIFGGDIFVHDRQTGTTERVSVASDGTEANDGIWGSRVPSISADGRYVAFASFASNLVPGDTNGFDDIFVHDRQASTTERVSVASDGTELIWAAIVTAISADGRYVAFVSPDPTLVPGVTDHGEEVFVHDRETGTTELVSVATDGTAGNDDSPGHVHTRPVALSADGRHVAFTSDASNLVPGDTNDARDIFVRERGSALVSWVPQEPVSETLAPGESQAIEVTVDATSLEPGDHTATLYLATDSGRRPQVKIPVDVTVVESACPVPDERETVVIGGIDSGVPNRMTGDGCTINDLVRDEDPWPNHGAFMRHVGEVSKQLVADEVISARERGEIIRAAARSDIGGRRGPR